MPQAPRQMKLQVSNPVSASNKWRDRMFKDIQAKLHAPKNQHNSFGNYNYRSCEDILEAVKPLLHELDWYLTISDEIINHGDRFYVEATVTVFNEEGTIVRSAKGIAREQETKKGMDAAQITGAASSYARKYALNGLFAIDDTKDADTMDNRESAKKEELSSDNKPLVETMLSVIELISTKDSGHKWKRDNQETIDKLGSDKGTVMTAYLKKMKEFN
jgi:hypothetical protein